MTAGRKSYMSGRLEMIMGAAQLRLFGAISISLAVLAGLLAYGWYVSRDAGGPSEVAARDEASVAAPERSEAAPESGEDEEPVAGRTEPNESATASRDTEEGAADEAPDSSATGEPMGPANAQAALSFDLVRVTAAGELVVAGRASPDWTVELMANGDVIGRDEASPTGEFVIVPDKSIETNDQILTLRALSPDGEEQVTSEQSVAIGAGAEGEAPVVVLDRPDAPSEVLQAPQELARSSDEAVGQQQGADAETAEGSAGESDAETPDRAADGTIARVTEDEQTAESTDEGAPEGGERAGSELSVRAVEYEEAGRLFVTGDASAGAILRVYLNDTFLREITTSGDERFVFDLDVVLPPGHYRVRVDEVEDEEGRVASRIEVPYSRDAVPETAAIAGAGGAGAGISGGVDVESGAEAEVSGALGATPPSTGTPDPQEPQVVVIRRGDNLWRIARSTYGRGVRYTTIYQANLDFIRDPNLIYPDQIFVLPLGEASELQAN